MWYAQNPCTPDKEFLEKAWKRQRSLTKPPESLGNLESIATTLCAMQRTLSPSIENIEIAVFAADHGVVEENISAFPQVVTVEMVKNFVSGGAAISVLAKEIGANLKIINAGVNCDQPFDLPVINRPVAAGTENISKQPAMTIDQCEQALELGKHIVSTYSKDVQMIIGGDMGIGNTTAASALAVAYGIGEVANLAGPGTGLDKQGIKRKIDIIQRSVRRLRGDESIVEILAQLGGFEIAALVGYFIHGAQKQIPILVDGFICTSAALAACKINPDVRHWMLFSHTSAEPGHKMILQALQADSILSLGMRLGEGSGAAVAVPILRAACALHRKMATFAQAGVSQG